MKKTVEKLLKAIRLYCLECCGNQKEEVKKCEIKDCKLWQYRFGKITKEKKKKCK